MEKQLIYAMTGEVKSGDKNTILKSGAIGSCIVVTSYDKKSKAGVMAHIMLPGESPENKATPKTRYAKNAVIKLLELMKLNNSNMDDIKVCLAGGANVLQRKDDIIWQNIIDSVEQIIRENGITVLAKSLGGVLRRSVSLDVETGLLNYTIGDDPEKLFWRFEL